MPPWVAYLVALTGWPDIDWVDVEMLRLGMGVEYVAAVVFPVLVVLYLDVRPPRWARIVLCLACCVAVSAFIKQGLGWQAVTLFWVGGTITYAGWLFATPNESSVRSLMSRMLLTVGCLIPILFAVIVVAKLTGADSMVLMGFCYFAVLHIIEATGGFARFHQRFAGLQGAMETHP